MARVHTQPCAVMWPSRDNSLTGLWSHLRNHLFRELFEIADLGVQWLGVVAHDVGIAEADDRIGDALVLQALDAVGSVGVDGHDVDLERPGATLLCANLVEPVDQPVEFGTAAATVHPAVTARR